MPRLNTVGLRESVVKARSEELVGRCMEGSGSFLI